MLTRKYYEMIAVAIRRALARVYSDAIASDGVGILAGELADAFAADNPKRVSPDGRVSGFDRARFLKAAGYACERTDGACGVEVQS